MLLLTDADVLSMPPPGQVSAFAPSSGQLNTHFHSGLGHCTCYSLSCSLEMLHVWLHFLTQENVHQSLFFWPDPIKAKTIEPAQARLWMIPKWLLREPRGEGVRPPGG